jgi:hypothetical protein
MGALTPKERDTLRRAGFIPREIKDFNNATAIDGSAQDLNFAAPNFQAMIRNRIRRVASLKKAGWSDQRIANLIGSYYSEKHRSKRTAYDFLQIEESPSARQRPETDNSLARRLLKMSRIRATMGMSYSQGIKPTQIPRNIPKRPDVS